MGANSVGVVGIGAILPDALDSTSLWRNLLAGHSAIRPVPEELWPERTFYDPSRKGIDKTYSRLGGVVRGFEFSARDFNLPPLAERDVDLSQKAALLAARAALAEVGITGPTDGLNAGVFIGNVMGGTQQRSERVLATSHLALEATLEALPSMQGLGAELRERVLAELRQAWYAQFTSISGYSLPGALGNIIAARVSHFYNLHGPAQTIDAACASSLAAIEAAVLGLRTHRFDLALAGGVDFVMDPAAYAGFAAMGALSDTGSFPFDQRADGFVMGEGAVLFVLKRLDEARAAGDHIYGIIDGIGSSSDGRGRSLVAPNHRGQVRALKRAYADAGVSPERLGYLEAHGTATPIGDPMEVLAMREAFGDYQPGSVPLGSIKANLGHLKGAAGAAGLLRALLALDARTIPPQANFDKVNPRCKLDSSPFRIPRQAEEWPAGKTHAGVSAFGFGGINYHAVLRQAEEPSSASRSQKRSSLSRNKETALDFGIVAFGADSRAELLREADTLRAKASGPASLVAALRERPEPRTAPFRVAFFAEGRDDTRAMFEAVIAGISQQASAARLTSLGIHYRETPAFGREGLAFMFPGQGSQYLGMLAGLRGKFPVIDETLKEADEILHGHFPEPLSSYFAAAGEGTERARFQQLSDTRVLQPAIVACNEALRRVLLPLTEPGLVFGHSLGECSAAIAAGVMSFRDGLELAAARGQAMAEASPGEPGMLLQVVAAADKLTPMLPSLGEGVAIANKNCSRQTVLGGRAAAIREAEKRLRAAGLDCSVLPVSHAFHTELMRPAVERLRARLDAMALESPRTGFLSGLDGKPAPRNGEAPGWFRASLSRQVAEPVEYLELVRTAFARGARVFVEVGPKQAQCGFVADILGDSPHRVVPTCHPKIGELVSLGRAVAALVADGLVPYGGRPSAQAVQGRVARRPPFVGRLPESAAPPVSVPAPAPRAPEPVAPPVPAAASVAASVAAASVAAASVAPTFSQVLDQVSDDPAFWQFVARQASAMASYLVGSYKALAPSLQPVAPQPERTPAAPVVVAPPPSATAVAPAPAPLPPPAAALADDPPVEEGSMGVSMGAPLESGAHPPGRPEGERAETPGAGPTPSVSALEPPTQGSLAETLLSAVAQKTGYSREELKLDANLEYELGVDSISQIEIIAHLQQELQLPPDESFRISDYPTLRALIAYVESRAPSSGSPPRPTAAPSDGGASAAVDLLFDPPFYCRRLVLEPCPVPGEEVPLGRTLVLHDGAAPHLVARLGGAALRVSPGTPAGEIAAALDQGIDTLVVLGDSSGHGESSPLDAANDAVQTVFRTGLGLFAAKDLRARVVVVAGTGAASCPGQASRVACVAATTGAWRSLFRELCEAKLPATCELRIIEVDGVLDSRAEAIALEIGSRGPSEVRLALAGERTTPVLRAVESATRPALDASSVVLVTGGARGIMARIARALFEASRCKLVLVGRTASDGRAQPPFDPATARAAARDALGEPASAREINAHVEDQRRRAEVAETLAALASAKAEVLYVQADLGGPGQLARAVAAARERFGRVDLLVHGAGVDNSKALTAKREQELLDVLRPKLAPLTDLAGGSGVPERPFLVAVSSIAARFGNSGQLEYSAANEALARVAVGEGGLALDFGPWRETGMAARLEQAMKARGIDLLDCDVAAKVTAGAIAGWRTGEYVITGRLGRSLPGPLGTPVAVDLDVPGSELVTSYELRLEDLSWLRDHRWQGVGLVPAVVSLAGFIDAARALVPSLPVTSVEGFELQGPIPVREARSTRVQLKAVRGQAGAMGLPIETQILAGKREIQRATVVLGGPVVASCAPTPADTTPGPSRDEVYAVFFHGESFRVLETTRLGEACALGVSRPLDLPLGADLPVASRAATLAREVALQTAGIFVAVRRHEAALPAGLSRLTLLSTPRAGEVVTAFALFLGENAGTSRFDVVLTGEDGRVIERLDGLALRKTSAVKANAPAPAVAVREPSVAFAPSPGE